MRHQRAGAHRAQQQAFDQCLPATGHRRAGARSSSHGGWLPSGVPAVPWIRQVESPLIAAARCSETQLLAVPGTRRRAATLIGRQRCDRNLDQPPLSAILRHDFAAVGEPATEQVGDDGLRRQPPVPAGAGVRRGARARRVLRRTAVRRARAAPAQGRAHVGSAGRKATGRHSRRSSSASRSS